MDQKGDATTAVRPQIDAPWGPDEAFVIVVIEGPDAGKSFTLDGTQPSRVLVGQSPVCVIRLSDKHVSRRHAALDLSGRRLHLTDLRSTNGTFADGIAVNDAFLTGGEIVRMGATAFRVERTTPTELVEIPSRTRFGSMVGASLEMRRLYPLCERLAQSNVTLIIEGETGTGKEVLAESIHEEGPRAAGPFVVFDCTAVAPNLVESELFGHEKGSFTGAVSSHKGVFEQAHGGTLLIDEIGDLSPTLQPKLLRALERSEVKRIGGDRPIRVDVRVMAATRRDLDQEVQAGQFRDDLFFRLAVARIELPPLRERRGDIAVLAAHFWQALSHVGGSAPKPPVGDASVPYDLLRRWEAYSWPGNLRELHNAVARQIALGSLARLDAARPSADSAPSSAGPASISASQAQAAPSDLFSTILALDLPFTEARQRVLDEFERLYVERVLEKHGGSVVRAAAASGIARRYFQIVRARSSKG
jgi:two-component system, NtrC family, response regulator HydG